MTNPHEAEVARPSEELRHAREAVQRALDAESLDDVTLFRYGPRNALRMVRLSAERAVAAIVARAEAEPAPPVSQSVEEARERLEFAAVAWPVHAVDPIKARDVIRERIAAFERAVRDAAYADESKR